MKSRFNLFKIKIITFLLILLVFHACKPGISDRESGIISGDLIIFHAGSLSVPFRDLKAEFEKLYPQCHVVLEAAGSVDCTRKITDLKRDCDIIASADYQVINKFLIPDYTDSCFHFAGNKMIIAFNEKSRLNDKINPGNWYEIIQQKEVFYGRSDPDSDPCGYRSILVMKLAEKFYGISGFTNVMLRKDRKFIRPKEVDLLSLLETHSLDYIFIYKSNAVQHSLKFIELPDSINLSSAGLQEWYQEVTVDIAGKKPGEKIKQKGEAIIYGISILRNAPNLEASQAFIQFLLSDKGKDIIERNGQPALY